MLRILGIICDIFLIAIFAFVALLVFFLFAQSSDIEFPAVYYSSMHSLFHPFLQMVRGVVGVQYSDYQGHQIEMAHSILIVLSIGVFLVLLTVSKTLYHWDNVVNIFSRRMQQKFFSWQVERNSKKVVWTSLGNVYKPETGALLAIELDNMQKYPQMWAELQKDINTLPQTQRVYVQDYRLLLIFPSTSETIRYIQKFQTLFKQVYDNTRVYVENKPVFRMAVQSLANENSLFEEENFIWALLQCAGPNQVFMSPIAKEQFDMQNQKQPFPGNTLSVTLVGTFAKLGHRTYVDVYRLVFSRGNLS